jgi:hypothetical protein
MKCEVRRQISIALKNEPGQLATVCRLLADKGVNIDALSILDNVEQGVIRLLTSDSSIARNVLTAHGCYVVEAEVLEVEMRNAPGALARVAARLAQAGVNIEYAYGTEAVSDDCMRVCFKLSNPSSALDLLIGLGNEP